MEQLVGVIAETPKGSRSKYVWDENQRIIKLKKSMPLGFIFPFDFGMIPGTLAEDGDPLDVLLLMEDALYPGTFVDVRIIGALKAEQTKNKRVRNDRLIAVVPTCPVFGHLESINTVSEQLKRHIEQFFATYNLLQMKEFKALGWADEQEAMKLLQESLR